MGNGIPNDDYVLTAHIDTVTSLSLSNLQIGDLTGIEDFLALEHLHIFGLWSGSSADFHLDLSQNINLLTIYHEGSSFTSIDVSGCHNLQSFGVNNSEIDSINLSQNYSLTYIVVWFNPNLTYLNIQNGNNHNLTHLNTTYTQLPTQTHLYKAFRPPAPIAHGL